MTWGKHKPKGSSRVGRIIRVEQAACSARNGRLKQVDNLIFSQTAVLSSQASTPHEELVLEPGMDDPTTVLALNERHFGFARFFQTFPDL
jgi:hypothetical protein